MTGRLQIRNGVFYAVINYKDSSGNYRQKWISTGLKERGNKKLAKQFLEEQLSNFQEEETMQPTTTEPQPKVPENNIPFMEYIKQYVENKKTMLSPSTFAGYMHIYKTLHNFYGDKLLLKDVTYLTLLEFYDYMKNEKHVKNVSIKRYKEVLAPALSIAYRDDLIPKNPYEFMPKLKREKPKHDYYNKNELEQLFEISDKTPIGLIVRVAAFYGFRRSEISGLRWQSIDFDNKTITIENKVLNFKKEIICSEVLKTLSSNRTLPLFPEIEERLLKRKEEIEKNKLLYGACYNHKFDDYVFVNDIGDLYLPDFITHYFGELIKKHKLKHIRFHDLRHSCASLLVANGVPMKNIQEWLGHSSYNLTADTYSHLDFESKKQSANVISKALSGEETDEELDDEIKKLEQALKEKQEQRRKRSQDFEM